MSNIIYKVPIVFKKKYCRWNYIIIYWIMFGRNRIFSETYFHGEYFAGNVGILLGYVKVYCFE